MFNISGLVRFRRRASCVIRPSVDFHNHALIGEAVAGERPLVSAVMNSVTPQIGVHDLAAALEQGAYLVDVREPHEWAKARVNGATLIPLGSVTERVAEIAADATVYVICRSGGRSDRAAGWLRTQGVSAVNVDGGILAWMAAGLPVDGDGDEG